MLCMYTSKLFFMLEFSIVCLDAKIYIPLLSKQYRHAFNSITTMLLISFQILNICFGSQFKPSPTPLHRPKEEVNVEDIIDHVNFTCKEFHLEILQI